MVGAGIFPLLGAAGEVAGAAVWLSFLIAGAIALPQGYSFAKFGARYPSAAGLLITAAVAIVLAAGFDLSSIASIGSAIALLVFTLVTAAHFRVRDETGASTLVLSVAITSTVVVLVTFAITTLVEEPATAAALAVIILLGVALDLGWKRTRDGRIPVG